MIDRFGVVIRNGDLCSRCKSVYSGAHRSVVDRMNYAYLYRPNSTHQGLGRFLGPNGGKFKGSYEDRLRAVQLYIRLGKHIGMTSRDLGSLSPMIHCFDDLVVSWSIGTHPAAESDNTMFGLPQHKGSCTS